MENHIVKRGYVITDARDFSEEKLKILKIAQKDIFYLIDHGYPVKSASTFVGNHYVLSQRQRLALARATCPSETLEIRRNKIITNSFANKTVSIDGLNIIITLEVALSGSTLIQCMDGTIRDLAGLRGTYRLIDKTDAAIRLIAQQLVDMKIEKAIFYLDSPVSNTGKLKARIYQLFEQYPIEIDVQLVDNADVILEMKSYVITSDSIILNKCTSWINLIPLISEKYLIQLAYTDLSGRELHINERP